MKSDLDSLMQARNFDALFVTGAADHNPAMVYFTGISHLTGADLIKRRGEEPLLFHIPMERDEASKTGLAIRNLEDYPLRKLLEEMDGDLLRAVVARYKMIFSSLGLSQARVAVYGKIDSGEALAIFDALRQEMPGLTLVGELSNSVLLEARMTKDEAEVERIRRMGRITVDVVGDTADFLTSHRVKDEILVKPDGDPLRVEDVKNRINLWLSERGVENPEGTIFAIGYDAGVPHSGGNPASPIRLGQTIVFDIFPCEAGGGYFYDFTRTWCLGYATDKTQAIYEDVRFVYDQIVSELRIGGRCRDYQTRACELFEARGHPTGRSNPQTHHGYVHGLGHGVGLKVQERPFLTFNAADDDRLAAGCVVTIEPGLYYPERDLGIRLENTLWVRPEGRLEVLADFPMDLVLPV